MDGILESLPGCFAQAMFTGVRPLLVVVVHPLIQVLLQALQAGVDFLSKSNRVELFLNSPMEALTNTISLRTLDLSSGVVDVFDRQVKLIRMILIISSAIFCTPLGLG